MKKIIALLLTLVTLTLLLASCAQTGSATDTPAKIRIGYMTGPTGMGMAKLVADNGGLENGNDKYSFTKYADTAAAKADLAAGKVDMICLPTNEAALLYAIDKNVTVLAINCLNSLYLLSDKSTKINSFEELEGKTVYTCKNGTPIMVLNYIINALGIDATVSYTFEGKDILTPNDLGALVTAGKLPIAVMPEPVVTSSLIAIEKNGNTDIEYSIDIDLANEWKKVTDTPITMGCIVAAKSFVENHKTTTNNFLSEYKDSVNFVNKTENLDSAAEYVVETGVMNNAKPAKKALANLGEAIAYIDGKEMRSALINFYRAIGLTLYPDDEFYYNK